MPQSPPNELLELHTQAAAQFQSYDPVQIVSTFGEPQAEYAAIRRSAALMDLPQRSVLELSGKDRLLFLNNLLTNQTWDKTGGAGMGEGRVLYSFLLNTRGRIISDLHVLELGDRTLLELDVRMLDMVRSSLEKYLFTEQVKIVSCLETLSEIALHGPRVVDVLGQAPPDPLRVSRVRLFDSDVLCWRDDITGEGGCHLLVPRGAARMLWVNLLARFGSRTPGKRLLRPIGWAAFNTARIEAGRPLFGIDFDESVLPAETGQIARAVSFTKGCYLGQEIVARMHARDQVARQIAGLRLDTDILPVAGSKVFDNQSSIIGVITSSTISPLLSNTGICLALLKRPFFQIGTVVNVPAEGAMSKAAVVELPFIAGTCGT